MLYKTYESLARPDSIMPNESSNSVLFLKILILSRTQYWHVPERQMVPKIQKPLPPREWSVKDKVLMGFKHHLRQSGRQFIHGMRLVYGFSMLRTEIHRGCRGGGKERVRPLPQQPATLQRASRSCHTQLPHSVHVEGCPASYMCAGRVRLAYLICNSPL